VESQWVEHEVMAALEKERLHPGHTVLFLIQLDQSVTTTRQPWAASLRRERHIGNFCAWKEHDPYQQSFARLLRDLKAESLAG